MSKLYTEEQLREEILNVLNRLSIHHGYSTDEAADDMLELIKPIQLPTDEEIERQSKHWGLASDFFYKGAKWMRDKIKGGQGE